MKSWYQIDKRQANGELIVYHMVKANNRTSALLQYLGIEADMLRGINKPAGPDNYIVVDTFKNKKFVLNARTLKDKSFYIEVTRVTQ